MSISFANFAITVPISTKDSDIHGKISNPLEEVLIESLANGILNGENNVDAEILSEYKLSFNYFKFFASSERYN